MRSRVRRFFCVLEKWWECTEDCFCVSSCFHVLNGMLFLFAFFLWRLLVSYLHPVAYCLCRVWVQYHISVILIVVLLVWFYAGVCGLRVTTCYWFWALGTCHCRIWALDALVNFNAHFPLPFHSRGSEYPENYWFVHKVVGSRAETLCDKDASVS